MSGKISSFRGEEKMCSICKHFKPLTEFSKRRAISHGYQAACKICKREHERNRPNKKAYVHTLEQYKEWRDRNPEKASAHARVSYAVKTGKLVKQPCEKCGKQVRIEAHHTDYSKPLDVVWLCRQHHKEIHRTHGNEEIPYIDWKIRPRALPQQKFEDTSFNFGNEQA